MYSWFNVAKRTEIVYDNIMLNLKSSLSLRLMKYYTAGSWSGIMICLIVIILYICNYILDIIYPRKDIEICIELPWLQEQAKISGLDVNHKEQI
jgi:phosphatidylinositol glycan class A protein